MTTGEWISAFALAGSIAGIGLLYYQVKQSSDTAKVSLIISINRDLNSYADVAALIAANPINQWVDELELEKKERILDYVSYFEGIQLAMERGIFNIQEVDAYFANRFFRLANNPDIRRAIFLNSVEYQDAFRPIFSLHASLSSFRYQKGYEVLYGGEPLMIKSTD